MVAPTTTAEFELRRTMSEDWAASLADRPWIRESDRWGELLFCLVAQDCVIPQEDLRAAIERLDELDLLEPADLIAARQREKSEQAQWITEILQQEGMLPEQAERALVVLQDAAESVMRNHGGKLQRYVREHAERMLDAFCAQFEFSSIDDDAVSMAFTMWLQNCYNLPISLVDDEVREFCEEHAIGRQDLIDAADDIGVNVALIDDLIQLRMRLEAVQAPASCVPLELNHNEAEEVVSRV